MKRPRVDDFMKAVGEKFEVVIFTASLAKYADPVIDLLDKHRVCRHRLFREACTFHKVKEECKEKGRRRERGIRAIFFLTKTQKNIFFLLRAIT